MIQWVTSSYSLLDFCCLSIAEGEAQSFLYRLVDCVLNSGTQICSLLKATVITVRTPIILSESYI